MPDKRPLSTPGRKNATTPSVSVPQKVVLATGEQLRSETGRTYRIVRKLGEGGMGAVYEALGPEPFAIKVLFAPMSDQQLYQRFQREIAICAELRHPGIVQVFDWGVHQRSLPFMVMEMVPGQTLRVHFDRRAPRARLLDWTVQTLRALQAAHEAGVVHRDVKPENIMITPAGQARLMDFGMASRGGQHSLTATNVALGTAPYMSPEHLRAKAATPACDIYSVGVILYEGLAGRLPFNQKDLGAILVAMMTESPPALRSLKPDIPEALERVVEKMMARSTEERYASAAAASAALETTAG